METARLEEKIYAAFLSDEKLMGFLPEGGKSIFHLQAPSVYPDYPILVYAPISDVPVLHGDNAENLHRVTIRIHIIVAEDYAEIYLEIKKLMSELGFTRVQATPLIEDGKKILAADFKIILEA